MKSFESPEEFSAYLNGLANGFNGRITTQVTKAANHLRASARGMLGTYQGVDRGTAAWLPLTEQTKQRRARKGYTPDNPLLASGRLRASINMSVTADAGNSGVTAVIGSDLPYAILQERGGTSSEGKLVPPRPFLAKAGARNSEAINGAIGSSAYLILAGKRVASNIFE